MLTQEKLEQCLSFWITALIFIVYLVFLFHLKLHAGARGALPLPQPLPSR